MGAGRVDDVGLDAGDRIGRADDLDLRRILGIRDLHGFVGRNHRRSGLLHLSDRSRVGLVGGLRAFFVLDFRLRAEAAGFHRVVDRTAERAEHIVGHTTKGQPFVRVLGHGRGLFDAFEAATLVALRVTDRRDGVGAEAQDRDTTTARDHAAVLTEGAVEAVASHVRNGLDGRGAVRVDVLRSALDGGVRVEVRVRIRGGVDVRALRESRDGQRAGQNGSEKMSAFHVVFSGLDLS